VATISVLQLVLVTLGVIGFGVTPSSYPLLALACVSASLGFVGFMMLVAGLARTEEGAGGAGWAFLMPMTLFGGGMMPQFVMPGWMQMVGNVSPVKWAIRGIEGAMWRDFTLVEMLLPCSILVVFGAVCFVAGVRALR
jgi:ABC-2 type transport system permease protein